MMPSTSVRPAAIRNSVTPSCTPFSNCSKTRVQGIKKGASPRPSLSTWPASPLHLAVLVVRVLVLLEHRPLDAHLDVAARQLHRVQKIEVLDRVVVVVELERPADRGVVRLAHRHGEGLRVLEVAFGGLDRGVDQ